MTWEKAFEVRGRLLSLVQRGSIPGLGIKQESWLRRAAQTSDDLWAHLVGMERASVTERQHQEMEERLAARDARRPPNFFNLHPGPHAERFASVLSGLLPKFTRFSSNDALARVWLSTARRERQADVDRSPQVVSEQACYDFLGRDPSSSPLADDILGTAAYSWENSDPLQRAQAVLFKHDEACLLPG